MDKFRLALVLIVLVLVLPVILNYGHVSTTPPAETEVPPSPAASEARRPSTGAIEAAYRAGSSGAVVRETGVVKRILPDDLEIPRHQRFIVRLGSGHTVLIAHNIDIAPRISNLAIGSEVAFQGVYEWNDQGGVVHWTHHDPDGSHPDGYLLYGGRYFQ